MIQLPFSCFPKLDICWLHLYLPSNMSAYLVFWFDMFSFTKIYNIQYSRLQKIVVSFSQRFDSIKTLLVSGVFLTFMWVYSAIVTNAIWLTGSQKISFHNDTKKVKSTSWLIALDSHHFSEQFPSSISSVLITYIDWQWFLVLLLQTI